MSQQIVKYQDHEFFVSDIGGVKQIMCKVKNGTFGGAEALSITTVHDPSKISDYQGLVDTINSTLGTSFELSGLNILHPKLGS